MGAPDPRRPVVAILGPTAIGKTSLAVEVALRTHGEVVTADSVQVYRGLDVGSAKPSLAERKGVPHHLIDVVDPRDPMTVGRYQDLTRRAIQEIHDRGRLPIVTGGTGLYLRAALGEWEIPRIPPDPEGRAIRRALAEAQGTPALWENLRQMYPDRAAELSPQDLPRIVRAFEVGGIKGEPKASPYRSLKIGLWAPREDVYRNITLRADALWTGGMIDEARGLLADGVPLGRAPASALGYREAISYLKGRATLPEAIRIFLTNSRHLAKRQMTWWRKESDIYWVDVREKTPLEKMVRATEALLSGEEESVRADVSTPAF